MSALEQLAGRESLPEPLSVGRGLEQAFGRRLEPLPAQCREALLVAAASAQDEPDTVASAVRSIGLTAAAFDPAERAGLISIVDGAAEFRHPLLRSVIYQRATGEQRRTAHAALAAVSDGTADRRAWHLAAAATGPDEHVAAILEDAAQRASARGGRALRRRGHSNGQRR